MQPIWSASILADLNEYGTIIAILEVDESGFDAIDDNYQRIIDFFQLFLEFLYGHRSSSWRLDTSI
jgi:hypothetical protein